MDTLFTKYSKLFDAGHWKVKSFKATLGAKPVYKKATPVPYALKEQVKAELTALNNKVSLRRLSIVAGLAL